MSNIKDVTIKQRLYDFIVLAGVQVKPPCYSIFSARFLHHWAHAPEIHAVSHVEHEKKGFMVFYFSARM